MDTHNLAYHGGRRQMDKQEEIREGVLMRIASASDAWAFTGIRLLTPDDVADEILAYLHSQGAVLKVEGKLPALLQKQGPHREFAEKDLKRRLAQSGYAAVEPLIKETND